MPEASSVGSVPRPIGRPAVKTPQKKSSGPMVGMIVLGVLAVAGLAVAGFLFSKQGAMSKELSAHRAGAADAARVANVPVETNDVDWGQIWPKITAGLSALRAESERLAGRIRQMEQELEAAARLQTELQTAQANAQRSAQQLADANAKLEESTRKLADLENKLKAAQSALDQATARISELEARLSASSEGKVAETTDGTEPVVAGEEGASPNPAPREPEPVMVTLSHTFPPGRSDLLAAVGYDDRTGTMIVRFQKGTEVRYSNIPRSLYEQLVTSPTFETFYRIRILGRYPSVPDDKAAVREHHRL